MGRGKRPAHISQTLCVGPGRPVCLERGEGPAVSGCPQFGRRGAAAPLSPCAEPLGRNSPEWSSGWRPATYRALRRATPHAALG